jgi:hypothetical protein
MNQRRNGESISESLTGSHFIGANLGFASLLRRGMPRPARHSILQEGSSMPSISLHRPVTKALLAAALLTAALPLSGCYTPGERALGGGIIGGLGGAGIGALASGGLAGPTLATAAVGAAGGALIGAATAPTPRYHRRPRYYY